MYRTLATCCLALGLAAQLPPRGHAEEVCPVDRVPAVAVPAMKRRLASNDQVLIVALGSSSTEGWMATAPAHTYPARLQSNLTTAYPLAHIAVVNRGIGGQDAMEEVARLDSDVLALRPDVVIWQVGANGAMAHSDPAVFRKLVSTGIERLRAVGIDVILMDNQRSPMILASPEHAVMEDTLAALAVHYDVALFSRGSLMDGWKRAGEPYEEFLAKDGVHMNDLGYRCVADALAAAMQQGLGQAQQPRLAAAHITD